MYRKCLCVNWAFAVVPIAKPNYSWMQTSVNFLKAPPKTAAQFPFNKAITSYIGLEYVCWVKGIDWYNCHIVLQTPSSPKPRYTRHPCLHYQGKSTFQSLFQWVFGKAYISWKLFDACLLRL